MMTTVEQPTTTVTTRISQHLRDELDALTKATGRTRNDLVEEAISRFVDVEHWQLSDIAAGVRDADADDFASGEEIDSARAKYRSADRAHVHDGEE